MTDEEWKKRIRISRSEIPENHYVVIKRISEALDRREKSPDEWTNLDDHWLQMDDFALRYSYDVGYGFDAERKIMIDALYESYKKMKISS